MKMGVEQSYDQYPNQRELVELNEKLHETLSMINFTIITSMHDSSIMSS